MSDLKLKYDSLDAGAKGIFFEYVITALIARGGFEGKTALDVGANYGVHTTNFLRAVGKSGQVIAFEPIPELAKRLRDLNLENLAVHEVALSNLQGSARFFIGEDSGYSTLHLPEGDVIKNGIHVSQEITVQVDRLDDVIDLPEGDRIAVVKIDVEGKELEVLEGGLATILRDRPLVIMEFDATKVTAEGRAVLEKLTANSFRLVDFFGEEKAFPAPEDWNILLVPEEANLRKIGDCCRSAIRSFLASGENWRPGQGLLPEVRGPFRRLLSWVRTCTRK